MSRFGTLLALYQTLRFSLESVDRAYELTSRARDSSSFLRSALAKFVGRKINEIIRQWIG